MVFNIYNGYGQTKKIFKKINLIWLLKLFQKLYRNLKLFSIIFSSTCNINDVFKFVVVTDTSEIPLRRKKYLSTVFKNRYHKQD